VLLKSSNRIADITGPEHLGWLHARLVGQVTKTTHLARIGNTTSAGADPAQAIFPLEETHVSTAGA
jgi:hypothetical protein